MELEKRLAELEEELKKTKPGSPEYLAITQDYSTLMKAWNESRRTDAEIKFKEETLALEESKTEAEIEEQKNRTEIEKKATSWKRRVAEIAVGTLVPMGLVMLWEGSGRILPRSPMSWINKPRIKM